MKIEEVLVKLSNRIAEAYDLDLAEEMTDIYVELVDKINNSSKQYWSLVGKLATIEKEREELRRKLDEELWLRSREVKEVQVRYESRRFGGDPE